MEHKAAGAPTIACCIHNQMFEKLSDVIQAAGETWVLENFSDLKHLKASLDTFLPECVLFEVDNPDFYNREYERLRSISSEKHLPVLLSARADGRQGLWNKIKRSGDTEFYVALCEEEEIYASLNAVLHARQKERDLRAVNHHLADLVEQRARSAQEDEGNYRFLFDSCSDALMVIDVEGDGEHARLHDLNDTAVKWFGYSRENKAGFPLSQFFSFLYTKKASGNISDILRHAELHIESLMRTREGAEIPIEIFTRTAALEGYKCRLFVVARSLEQAKKYPEKGNIAEDFHLLASQTGLLMYEGNLKTEQMIWGGGMADFTGYTPREMMRTGLKGWRERILPEDYRYVINSINGAINKLGKYELEYRIVQKSGEIRYVEDHGVVLPDEQGRAERLLGAIKDITLRIQTQKQREQLDIELQHSQRLESLGVLAGGIAHDFNNILAGIIGLTDLALREVPVDSFVHEDLTEVLQAANRAKELVRQILAFSRQSGQERNPIYLHIIAREVIKLLRASLPPTVEIIDSADVHSGAVMANAAQMYQVITNFSTNAAQAMKKNTGKIEIKVNDIYIDEHEAGKYPGLGPGPYVKLAVIDSGHGMAESVLARVFDPFFTTKGPGEGTGMGLAVVHGIVTDHGGVVTAESRLGHGSRFDAYLPRIAGVKVEEMQSPEKLCGGNEKILFVDDDIAVLRFAESALPRLGFQLTTSVNGEEGLNTFLTHSKNFDLVITDQVMPKMSGLELAKEVHVHSPHTPILMFTGFSEEILPETLVGCGVVEVVYKPIIIKELVEAIRRAVDTAARQSP